MEIDADSGWRRTGRTVMKRRLLRSKSIDLSVIAWSDRRTDHRWQSVSHSQPSLDLLSIFSFVHTHFVLGSLILDTFIYISLFLYSRHVFPRDLRVCVSALLFLSDEITPLLLRMHRRNWISYQSMYQSIHLSHRSLRTGPAIIAGYVATANQLYTHCVCCVRITDLSIWSRPIYLWSLHTCAFFNHDVKRHLYLVGFLLLINCFILSFVLIIDLRYRSVKSDCLWAHIHK